MISQSCCYEKAIPRAKKLQTLYFNSGVYVLHIPHTSCDLTHYNNSGSCVPTCQHSSGHSISTAHGKGDLFIDLQQCSENLRFYRYLLETGSMAKALALAKHTEPVCDLTTREGELRLSYLLNTYACVSL